MLTTHVTIPRAFRVSDQRQAEPIYGQRIRLPDGFPSRDRLVHIVHPLRDVMGTFTGSYGCCLGLLDQISRPGWENADWRDWLLPMDAMITCLRCLVERGTLE